MTIASLAPTAATFKRRMHTFNTLVLKQAPLDAIIRDVERTVRTSPALFEQSDLLIDLSQLSDSTPLDWPALMTALRQLRLVPIAVTGGTSSHHRAAAAHGITVLSTHKTPPPPTTPSASPATHTSKVITQPVRSGQQVYARGGDLIVMAAVSPGAEVLADGHIHLYAPLRGRALAGLQGNTEARIFIQHMEAELIAIAGQYQVSEHLKDTWGQPCCAWLEQGSLRIQANWCLI